MKSVLYPNIGEEKVDEKQNTVKPTALSTKAPDESRHLVPCTRSSSPIPTLRAPGNRAAGTDHAREGARANRHGV